MLKYKGIIIQYLYDKDKSRHFIDGITEYNINAENKIEAFHKMFNHFYAKLWYSGEGSGDIDILDFEKIDDMEEKEQELRNHKCYCEYTLDLIEDNVKTQYFDL